MFEPDLRTDHTFHVSWCTSCNQKAAIPLSVTALERRPWRVVWRCPSCEKMTAAAVPAQMLDSFLDLDRAGGMRLSVREAKAFDTVTLDQLNRALAEEL